MIYQINKGCKSFGANEILNDIQFEIKNNEKIAIVGRNGCGKSTLLKCIAEIDLFDKGIVHKQNGIKIGYLAQNTISDENKKVIDELNEAYQEVFIMKKSLEELEKIMKNDYSDEVLNKYALLQSKFEQLHGYDYQNEMMSVFTKFNFSVSDMDRKIKTFSGGQKTRIAFIKLLLMKPDILLLDEPTNHLDLSTIEWLEGYLKRYPKAIVLVSHDRMFMDDVVDIVYEIEYGTMKKYSGNYSNFVLQKKADLERQLSIYNNQQSEINRLEELIEKFRYKKNKAAFAQSKIKYLERMDKIEAPVASNDKTFKAIFTPKVKGGKSVLIADELEIGYDIVLCKVNLEIRQHDKIAILGDNGVGKSTLIKTLAGKIEPVSGSYLYGHQIEIGYFDQQTAQLNSSKTVIEELWDEYPDLDRTKVRTVLGQFLFKADDVFKNVNVLSGGEKVRLSFAKLLLKQANFLILDEPTNHLDIPGKEALEEALKNYSGTILFVSHDRYFIKEIATAILLIEKDKVSFFPYGYEQYNNSDKTKEDIVIEKKEPKKTFKSTDKKKEILKVEKEINELEMLLETKRKLRFEPDYYHDYRKMHELDNEIDEIHNKIENLLIKWEELHS